MISLMWLKKYGHKKYLEKQIDFFLSRDKGWDLEQTESVFIWFIKAI